ncbi:MAG: hypothetical protein AAFO07_13155 [Bacteroidota bacterium]
MQAPFFTNTSLKSLIERFEQQILPKAEWTHEAHLAVAVWYTHHYCATVALERVRKNITLHNESVGIANTDTSGYHETITQFWLNTVREFLKNNDSADLVDKVIRESHNSYPRTSF